MKEILLTNREKLKLENELTKYESDIKNRIKHFLIAIIGGNLIAGTIAYSNYGDRNGRLYLGILILMSLLLIPIGIFFLKSKKRINKLKSDIKKGKKIEGKGKIKSLNKFNQTIYLDNGIKGFISIEYFGEFKKGDIVKYKISPSNEYLFDFIKD